MKPSMVWFCIAGITSPSGIETGDAPSLRNGSMCIGAPPGTRILPPLLDSTPDLKAFIHSCETSLIVGDDSFMVNCCADAENAAASRMPAIQILLMLPLLVTQKQLDPHQRNPGDVRDQQQRDEI